jgi:hypothetical protein
MSRRALPWALCFIWGLALTVNAQTQSSDNATADGDPPAVENECDGLAGAAWGLCNAYCEAMDCDSAAPHASAEACDRIGQKLVALVPDRQPLCGSAPAAQCDCFADVSDIDVDPATACTVEVGDAILLQGFAVVGGEVVPVSYAAGTSPTSGALVCAVDGLEISQTGTQVEICRSIIEEFVAANSIPPC